MQEVFAALADGNRRKIIELLHHQDSTLLELADEFEISFQALSKHIQVLEEAGIVKKQKRGKYRQLSLNREALLLSLQWISYHSSFWNKSFDRLGEMLNQHNEDGNPQ